MKRLLYPLIILCMLYGCSGNNRGGSTGINEHKLICPLDPGIDLTDLKDCTLAARFTTKDFNWMGGNLTFEAFSEDLYDAVDIQTMVLGDTLLYQGEKMVIESIEKGNNTIDINGGVEEMGAWLMSAGGGTYRSYTFDDHSMYTSLGKAQVILSDDFRIVDCGPMPEDPYDTISTNQKLYLDTLRRQEFWTLNTTVQIENGQITEILRRWIP